MFRKNKSVEEYMEISNKVKIPGEKKKVININERRRGKMNKKAIISAAMVAIVAGGVFFTNMGSGLKVATNIEPIKVYASEGNRDSIVEFKKGKKVEIEKQFAEVILNGEKGSSEIKNSGIILDIVAKDMVAIRLKANKGRFTAVYGEKGVENSGAEKILEADKKVIYKDEMDRDSKELEKEIFKAQEKEVLEGGTIEFDNLEGKIQEIGYCYTEEVQKNLNPETFGTVEIEIEAIYKDGKKSNQKLILTMNGDKQVVGELV